MKLSITDLSKYLGVAPKTIERWVKQGKLPISRKEGDYLFRMDELKKWASKHQIKLNRSEPTTKGLAPLIPLSIAVGNGGVHYNIQARDRESVFKECLKRIEAIPNNFKPALYDRLIEREKAHSTGIGNGIAMPHPREPLPYLNIPMISVCTLDTPLDFNSIDNQPIFALFFILSPTLKTHLHLLSVLSFCLKDNSFLNVLKTTPDPDQLIKKIEMLQVKNEL